MLLPSNPFLKAASLVEPSLALAVFSVFSDVISTDTVFLALRLSPDLTHSGQLVAARHSWQHPAGVTDQVLYNSCMQNEITPSVSLCLPLPKLCWWGRCNPRRCRVISVLWWCQSFPSSAVLWDPHWSALWKPCLGSCLPSMLVFLAFFPNNIQ